MFKRKYQGQERRKYIRLNSVFPVEFSLFNLSTGEVLSDWLQGFTQDIGKGGICLTANNVKDDIARKFSSRDTGLKINIHLPIFKNPVLASARCAWVSKKETSLHNQYTVGLAYEKIFPGDNRKIYNYALMKLILPRLTLAFIILITSVFLVAEFHNFKLRMANQNLVNEMVKISGQVRQSGQILREMKKEKENLEARLLENDMKIFKLEGSLNKKKILESEVKQFKEIIVKLNEDKKILQGKLQDLEAKEKNISQNLLVMETKKTSLEEKTIQKMYEWLKTHQNNHSGLIASYEGDNSLKDWAFIYDQALAVQVFLIFHDEPAAKNILDFFSAKAKTADGGGFTNAYYADDGGVAEYTVHSGPNIWLGIAVLQYTQRTKDKTYLPLATKIAKWLLTFQKQDPEGGIKGGPGITWFSTEHNLDAYAFLNMLYKITGNLDYRIAAEKIKSWLKINAYSREALPVKRGKGDSTIATDTYAWSISSLGPEILIAQMNMDPDKIIKFAEENCLVTTNFARPDGVNLEVTGFDFARQRHLPRGGVVSSEWTAQMILAYKMMADFHSAAGNHPYAKHYQERYQNYLTQLGQMIISSPSPTGQGQACMPYATQEFVDTGHGWFTPKGKSTGSVAGTSYTIFAYKGYNPLQLNSIEQKN